MSDEGPLVREKRGLPAQLLESNKVLYSGAEADVRLIFDLNWKLRAPERGHAARLFMGTSKVPLITLASLI